ncbi:unnamed protein product, partial [marine sediment metagenome]
TTLIIRIRLTHASGYFPREQVTSNAFTPTSALTW